MNKQPCQYFDWAQYDWVVYLSDNLFIHSSMPAIKMLLSLQIQNSGPVAPEEHLY